ncbi:MAG: hypothetical protein HYY04_04070, partial [Chloroflexi bacterium]|nr:hypothetical protein [Chloroflexota bacterium]
VDYYGERSGGYYYAKRACAPLLVSFKRVPYGAEVWVTSDRPVETGERRGTLKVSLGKFGGDIRWTRTQQVSIPANGSRAALRIDFRDLPRIRDTAQQFLAAELAAPGEATSENVFFFQPLRTVRPPTASLRAKVVATAPGQAKVRVSTDLFARNVSLRLPGARFDDNYFHLLPGQAKEVTLRTDRARARQIEVSALNARETLQLDLPL